MNAPAPVTAAEFDPVLLAVIANRLDSVIREMTNTLLRTGRSAVLAVSRDFSCSMVTGDDRLLSTAEGTPVHILGSHRQTASMKRLHPDYSEGDAFLHNDPYNGNTHPADHTILVPVFVDGVHLFTVCPKAHQADCGNAIPTTYHAWARDVYEEGALVFPCVKVESGYRPVEDIIRMCRARIRVPDQWYGDYLASLGAARIGERLLKQVVAKYGVDTMSAFYDAWFDYARHMGRRAISRLPRSTVRRTARHDPIPGILPDGFDVNVTLDIFPTDGRIVIDLRDNADCLPNGMNVSTTCALNSAVAGILNALPEDLPRNAGLLDCFEVLIRDNCAIGGPVFPHSCSVATTNLADRLVNAVQGAMAGLREDVGLAEGGVGMGIGASVISGRDRRRGKGGDYVNQLFAATASGPASALADGWLTYTLPVASGVCYRDSVEIDELKYPILFDHVRVVPGTGGAGQFRGAPANDVMFGPRFEAMEVVCAADGHTFPAAGVAGGERGSLGRIELVEADGTARPLGNAVNIVVQPGQKVRGLETSGAGYGDPLERTPARVVHDIANGIETRERAEAVYGVVLTDDELTPGVNAAATTELRAVRHRASNDR